LRQSLGSWNPLPAVNFIVSADTGESISPNFQEAASKLLFQLPAWSMLRIGLPHRGKLV